MTLATNFELFDLRVLVPERSLASRDDTENFSLSLPGGGYARLRDIATVRAATGSVEIIRRNQPLIRDADATSEPDPAGYRGRVIVPYTAGIGGL